MFKFFILIFLVAQSSYALRRPARPVRGRIFNGTNAEQGEFPFAANLRQVAGDNMHFCGSSILNENFILTAGHCVDCTENGTALSDPKDYNVQYGLVNITTDDTNSVDIKKFHCANYTEIYDGAYFENLYDIAILELANPLPDDGSWSPVTLARVFDSSAQQDGVIIGWGSTDDVYDTTVLKKLELNVYNNTVCGAATRNHWDHHVCVGSKSGYGGACYGDSGTAALVDGVQVGITSYLTIRPPECGYDNATSPTVYARVEKYFDWILTITPDVQSN